MIPRSFERRQKRRPRLVGIHLFMYSRLPTRAGVMNKLVIPLHTNTHIRTRTHSHALIHTHTNIFTNQAHSTFMTIYTYITYINFHILT